MPWEPPEPPLQAGGVKLRLFAADDAVTVAAACRDDAIVRFTFMEHGLTVDGARRWIERSSEWWPHGHPRFAIVSANDDGHLLGQVGIAVNEQQRSAEAYYWTVPGERRRGVAATSLGLVADWAFDRGIGRLFLLVHRRTLPRITWQHGWASCERESCGPTNRSRASGQISSRGHSFPMTHDRGDRQRTADVLGGGVTLTPNGLSRGNNAVRTAVCSHGPVHPTPPFFLFDGDCGFCRKWAGWLQRRVPPDVPFVAYQDVEDLGAYGLTGDDVETASYWIDQDGAPHRGAKSFAHVLRQGTRLWSALGALLDAPLVGDVADRLYPVIARNRHRLPAPGSHEPD